MKERGDVTVCVYAICKNEEKNITNWVTHLKDQGVDCIVVLDTGSTDNSVELLEQYSPFVNVEQQIIDPFDFSKARNIALDMVPKNIDICVTLDFDHICNDGWVNKIKDAILKGYDEVYGLLIENDKSKEGLTQYTSRNVHRNNGKYYWKRAVHEWLCTTDKNPKALYIDDFVINHYPDKSKNRGFYFDIIEREYKVDPKSLDNVIYYTNALYQYYDNEVKIKGLRIAYDAIVDSVVLTEDKYIIKEDVNEALLYGLCCSYAEVIKDFFPDNYNDAILVLRIAVLTEWRKYVRKPWYLLSYIAMKHKDFISYGLEAFKEMISITDRLQSWLEADYAWDEGNINVLSDYYTSIENDVLNENINKESKDMNGNLEMVFTNEEDTKKENKIAVYAICKNEEKFVDKWVDSMSEADFIAVLDTGSTDNTVEKLRARGVVVKEQVIDPWRFDVARNVAMEIVPEEYNILVSTDLDEILEPGWSIPLKEKWIEGFHERAIYKYSWSHLKNGEDGRVFQYDKIHSRNWIWKYPVHELLWNTVTQTNEYSVTLNLFNEIHLHHYPDMKKSRSSYLPLLELRASENPDDYYGLIYLSHEYYYRGFYEKSINTLNTVLKYHQNKCTLTEIASCYLFLGDNYMALKVPSLAVDNYLKAIGTDSTYREPYLNLAKAYMELKKWECAIEYIKLGIQNSYRHYLWIERDISWTYEPYDLLSLAYFYAGNKNKALSLAVKASDIDPDNQRLKTNVRIILDSFKDDELLLS